jgi:glycosyltransferase involved in cell wall biosynthesis
MTGDRIAETQGLRIAVNAFSTAVGGGRRHLLRVLPRIFELGRQHTFTVFIGPSLEREFRSQSHPNVVWRNVGFDGLATKTRLIWENTVFPLLLRRGGYDVVFCNANLSHFIDWTPRVIVVHNSLPFYPELHGVESARMRRRLRLLRWGTHHFMRRAAGTVFVSQRAREDALRGTGIVLRDEAVVYHGVDPGFGGQPHPEARREAGDRYGAPDGYVFYAGHFYRYKKFESLLEAWGRVPPGIMGGRRLLIAGEPHDPTYEAEVRAKVRELGLADAVRILGGLSLPELSLLHAGADVVAVMTACEAGSISVLEALASGRPILLSNRSAIPELGGDAALYADPDRPDEVASQLQRLLTDTALAEELGKRARARSTRFTWDASARGLLDLIERVGEHGRVRRRGH